MLEGESRSLVDFEIIRLIEKGLLKTSSVDLEERTQPSSFEPRIMNEIYLLNTEAKGFIRPNMEEPIYRTLLHQFPGKNRYKFTIDEGGFLLQAGHTYLFPLDERLILPEDLRVKASPKSSYGRLFNYSRLLADYNNNFDEVVGIGDKEIELWLLLQPLAFNCIVRPGMTFNQLRFFFGDNSKLSDRELKELYEKGPMLFSFDKEDKLIPIMNPDIFNGLRLNLDLTGESTHGIAGFKARKIYPGPIDLSRRDHNASDYFEPVVSDGKEILIHPDEYYLFSSKEFIKVPVNLNGELKDNSHVGFRGPLHFAGFFDNNFHGCCVFEVRSDEISPSILKDNMPLTELTFYRCLEPEHPYGEHINSNYHKQRGTKLSKFFSGVDYKELAKKYEKRNRDVLLLPDRELLPLKGPLSFRESPDGFEFLGEKQKADLEKRVAADPMFQSRWDCEDDEEVLQVIPYVLIFRGDEVFLYKRCEDPDEYGDTRLFNKLSVGAGGHIDKNKDAPDYLTNCIAREVDMEEIKFESGHSDPVLVGTLMAHKKPVDRVHFGLVYAVKTEGDVKPKEKSLIESESKFVSFNYLNDRLTDPDVEIETWTRILIPYLPEIKNYLE